MNAVKTLLFILEFVKIPIPFGAIAQLGERFNGIEEVRSSSLLSSTKHLTTIIEFPGQADLTQPGSWYYSDCI